MTIEVKLIELIDRSAAIGALEDLRRQINDTGVLPGVKGRLVEGQRGTVAAGVRVALETIAALPGAVRAHGPEPQDRDEDAWNE